MNNKNKTLKYSRPRALVLLFGTLEFDGRAQRMIQVLKQADLDIAIIDLESIHPADALTSIDLDRIKVKINASMNKLVKHFKFLMTTLNNFRSIKPKVVIAENFFTTGIALLVAWFSNAILIYDAYELIIPEKGQNKLRDIFWYRLEKLAVKKADLIIAASSERANIMAVHYKLKEIPFVVRNIPQQCFKKINKRQIIEEYPCLKKRFPEERLILYQGYVSISRGLNRFIEALYFMPPEYRLIVVGDGPDLFELQQLGKELKEQGRFCALGSVSNHKLIGIASLVDVGLISYPFLGLNNIHCASNKIFEYAQAGLPVVTTDQPPLKNILKEYKIGACIGEYYTPTQIAEVIMNVSEAGKESYALALKDFIDGNRWEDEAKLITAKIKSILTLIGESKEYGI